MWKLLTWVVLCGQIVQHVYGVVCELPVNCPSKTQKYLTDFGYLDPHRSECTEEDIMAALTKFQELNIGFKGLHVTGGCDNITTFVMDQPRCGCEDIVKGNETKMMKNTIRYVDPLSPQEFRTGNTKWGSRSLTWFVEKYPVKNNHLTRSQVDDAMRRGLQIWADKTKLTFTRAANSRADIVIRGTFSRMRFFPESGLVHFDDDEHFVLNSNSGTELYIVAAHEFGHTLGISHSNIKESLMAPYYRYSDNLQLHSDDISAIQSLYGPPDANPVHTTNAPIPTPRPTPPRPSPEVPDYCNIQVQASFRISDTSYIFSREVVSQRRRILKVYTMTSSGISVQGRDIR
ncbi:MMP10-like protein, partial [Mya arenaria]